MIKKSNLIYKEGIEDKINKDIIRNVRKGDGKNRASKGILLSSILGIITYSGYVAWPETTSEPVPIVERYLKRERVLNKLNILNSELSGEYKKKYREFVDDFRISINKIPEEVIDYRNDLRQARDYNCNQTLKGVGVLLGGFLGLMGMVNFFGKKR
jgi:hypothetical protein